MQSLWRDLTTTKFETKTMYKGESIQLTVDSSYNSYTPTISIWHTLFFLIQGTREQDFGIKLQWLMAVTKKFDQHTCPLWLYRFQEGRQHFQGKKWWNRFNLLENSVVSIYHRNYIYVNRPVNPCNTCCRQEISSWHRIIESRSTRKSDDISSIHSEPEFAGSI